MPRSTSPRRPALLDVNVLLAAAWPVHIHHAAARQWLGRQQPAGWATCPLTQAAFVRLSANPAVFRDALAPAAAFALLAAIVAWPGHRWLTDDVELSSSPLVNRANVLSHRQVSDAHVLAIALAADCTLATFDRGVVDLLPPDRNRADVVIIQ